MLAFLAGLLTNLYSQDTVTPVAYIAPGSVYTQQFDGLPYSGSFTLTGKGPFNLAGSPINGPELTGWQLLMIGGSGKNAVLPPAPAHPPEMASTVTEIPEVPTAP